MKRMIRAIWLASAVAVAGCATQPTHHVRIDAARGDVAAQPLHAGFERGTLADGTEYAVWYPTLAGPTYQPLGLYQHAVATNAQIAPGRHALIVISHGSGGDLTGHLDTAQRLAEAGFVVAALTHAGDNWRDHSRATDVMARPAALRRLTDHMLSGWQGAAQIDTRRIGAFGFSAGAFTVLTALGGRPDLSRIASHCADHPQLWVCTMLRQHPAAGSAPPASAPESPSADPRIRAAVIAAPALGFTFDAAGLSSVRAPIQIWQGEADDITPAPLYAQQVRRSLPRAPDYRLVPSAGHFDFLAPCAAPQRAPQICTSAPGFDRAAFHSQFNAEIVRFFARELR